ncbi:hypothetical protein K2173_010612 [Erythroxylum novogranatense]|uniref:Uncharacterized protein n=1 Tax=Erythroxylum novogranatense TaxID=1862640 RepID=A0AAV8TFU6_9ROSI|nr:hypothetical protein K2173_010612 [Erythroxylum novogranatense]
MTVSQGTGKAGRESQQGKDFLSSHIIAMDPYVFSLQLLKKLKFGAMAVVEYGYEVGDFRESLNKLLILEGEKKIQTRIVDQIEEMKGRKKKQE